MGKIFKRGYEASREEVAKQEEYRKKMGNRIYTFFIKAGKGGRNAEAEVNFLTEEPVNFDQHTVKRGDKYETYTCSGAGCPLCADGNRPTAKGAYLIVDQRHFEYEDKNGKTREGDEQIRLFVQGMRVVSQLDRLSNRYGLADKDMTVVRMGSGTSTTYMFEQGEDNKYSVKHIKELLPESIAEEWDGTKDGLMSIIEEQLTLEMAGGESDDDEDIDDGYADDDEEVVKEPPKKKKSGLSSKIGKKKSKSTFKKRGSKYLDDDEDEVPFN